MNGIHSFLPGKTREPTVPSQPGVREAEGLFPHCLAEASVGLPHRLVATVTTWGRVFVGRTVLCQWYPKNTSMAGKGGF